MSSRIAKQTGYYTELSVEKLKSPGYRPYIDVQNDSFGNVTTIGKQGTYLEFDAKKGEIESTRPIRIDKDAASSSKHHVATRDYVDTTASQGNLLVKHGTTYKLTRNTYLDDLVDYIKDNFSNALSASFDSTVLELQPGESFDGQGFWVTVPRLDNADHALGPKYLADNNLDAAQSKNQYVGFLTSTTSSISATSVDATTDTPTVANVNVYWGTPNDITDAQRQLPNVVTGAGAIVASNTPWIRCVACRVYGQPAVPDVRILDKARAYFSFNDTVDSNALGTNGSDTNITQVDGYFGSAAQFDDTSANLDIGDALSVGENGEFTTAFWVYLKDSSNNQILLGTDGNTSTTNRFYVRYAADYNNLEVYTADSNNQKTVDSKNDSIDKNKWHFVVVRRHVDTAASPTQSTVDVFIDGSSNAMQSGDHSILAGDITQGTMYLSGTGSSDGIVSGGLLDEVGIWGRTLTDEEITFLYNQTATSGIGGLVGEKLGTNGYYSSFEQCQVRGRINFPDSGGLTGRQTASNGAQNATNDIDMLFLECANHCQILPQAVGSGGFVGGNSFQAKCSVEFRACTAGQNAVPMIPYLEPTNNILGGLLAAAESGSFVGRNAGSAAENVSPEPRFIKITDSQLRYMQMSGEGAGGLVGANSGRNASISLTRISTPEQLDLMDTKNAGGLIGQNWNRFDGGSSSNADLVFERVTVFTSKMNGSNAGSLVGNIGNTNDGQININASTYNSPGIPNGSANETKTDNDVIDLDNSSGGSTLRHSFRDGSLGGIIFLGDSIPKQGNTSGLRTGQLYVDINDGNTIKMAS